MNIRFVPVLALFVSLLAVGCGSSDPVTRSVDITSNLFDYACANCPASLGTDTTAACLAAAEMYQPSATEVECARRVYDANRAVLDPVYACGNAALESYDRCYRGALATCPPASSDVMVCTSALQADLEACPRASADVAAMLDACTPD